MSGRPSEPTYDAVVVGTGSGGKLAAIELARQGRRVLAVEAGRFGGECPYVACVPAKSLLLSARSGLTWADAVLRRDEATDGRDDDGSRRTLTDEGVQVLRGRARLRARPRSGRDQQRDGQPDGHRLVIERPDGSELVASAPVVVLAPGSSPVRPDLPGLDDVPTWTSDQALSTSDQPGRLAILGGGAVGCELAQAFAGLGTRVTLVEVADRLLPGETAWVGELVATVLAADGIQVHAGRSAVRVGPQAGGPGVEVLLDDGQSVRADRLLLAGGRRPCTDGLGLVALGAARESSGAIAIDARCRVLDEAEVPIEGLFAVGDATAASSFTHTANYQARVVAAQVAGQGYDADYVAVPRAVYLTPAVFCVGLTPEQARDRDLAVLTSSFDVSEVERAALLAGAERPPGRRVVRGRVELVADARSGVLVGASCVGPEADSWGAELALAVRARLDVHLLSHHIRAFPTWSEAVYPAACSLDREMLER